MTTNGSRATSSNFALTTFAILAAAGVTIVGSYYLRIAQQNVKKRNRFIDNDNDDNNNDNTEYQREQASSDMMVDREIEINGDDDGSKARYRILKRNTITIAHGSVTGTCLKFAKQLQLKLKAKLVSAAASRGEKKTSTPIIQMGLIDEWDWWDELLNKEDDEDDGNNDTSSSSSSPPIVLILLPTHQGGSWPSTTSTNLREALQDLENDWRIEKAPLRNTQLGFATFGMGSSAYGDDATMGKPAKDAHQQLRALGAKALLSNAGIGDNSVGNRAKRAFQKWEKQVLQKLVDIYATDEDTTKKVWDDEQREPAVMDLEDMGRELENDDNNNNDEPDDTGKEMVTPSQAKALKKEGYKLIGSHSAVKLCRWTKHQLRGRGGCYKHTFYGITSYQCMEATPSLACANKCVFCWRHHKNPVGKEWRWKMDDPYQIVDQAVKQHVQMIKEAKGIPGVQMDRWQEAHTVRHCALSLVGEPIMYPRIDELLGELHYRNISTFLVTNGQHPSAIERIRPITQLYVSVDAPTPESLVAIDRPLFQDAWERLKTSLEALKAKGQRTVARLTVVKGWNSDELEGYAQLIALGCVSLVEVKGVTFCGKSDASNLNMSNTPWHHEVVALTVQLREELDKLRKTHPTIPAYDLACEHKHSCSVLLARVDQFAQDNLATGERKWFTWIDYDKFQELAARNAEDPLYTFAVQDYVAPTPEWALFGAAEEGFDPTDTRHRKKKKHPKYTHFDENGIPTHDHDNKQLSEEERAILMRQMEERKREIGAGTTVTELKGGEKLIDDASLMFRGMTVVK